MDTTLAHHGGMVAKLCNTQMPITLIETHFSSQLRREVLDGHNMGTAWQHDGKVMKHINTYYPNRNTFLITAQEGSIRWTQHGHSMVAWWQSYEIHKQTPIILIETHFSSQHWHNMAAKFRNTQTPLTLIAHITAQEGSIKWTQHWHSMAAR